MSTIDNTPLNKVVESIDKLPDLFSVAIAVGKKLENPDVGVSELSKIISIDQSLTTQLLKLCNSAQYGFSKKIATINDAIPKLGFKTLKNLVYVAISRGILQQEVKGYDLESGSLWENSVSCAVYAQYLAKKVGYKDPDAAFTAGLLRDIGKLIIHEYIGESYDKIIDLVYSQNIGFAEAESQILDFNHCEIGAKVAEKWNFPGVLIDSIKYHHSPNDAKSINVQDLEIISIVHIADAITMMLGSGLGNDGMMYKIEMQAMENLKIATTTASIEELLSEMTDLNSEIINMIGLANG